MNVFIKKIGERQRPSHSEKNFASLSEYISMAKIFVKKYGGVFATNLLSKDDAIANIASAIMDADWNFDENKSKQSSYRINAARWEMGKIINRLSKENNKSVYSLNFEVGEAGQKSVQLYQTLEDRNCSAVKQTEIRDLLTILSSRDKEIVSKRYLYGMELAEIAKEHDITSQRVSQIIKASLKKLKQECQ